VRVGGFFSSREWPGRGRARWRPHSSAPPLRKHKHTPTHLSQHVQAHPHDRQPRHAVEMADRQPAARPHQGGLAAEHAQRVAQRARDHRLAHGLGFSIPEG
jgi:hypothetical protein